MKRRDFLMLAGGAATGASFATGGSANAAEGGRRPNILWITCEDIAPHLGCYGDPEAITPNLDRLAAGGTRYNNAFSVAGVCAPSRSCLITSVYPSSLGTHHMRCSNQPPEHVKCFPEYLRNAGYYCTNNSKTDYNFAPPDTAWDECSKKAHWRNRPEPDQPFFAVFNLTMTHESRVGTLFKEDDELGAMLTPEERHDPAKADLPPYYPDTPVTRTHWAHYYDLITILDKRAGEILEQLEEDGFADNTIVFFFSDHGVGLPRAKRWMYDSGLHVPFIVRQPGQDNPGSTTDRLVSFVDFAPTVLSLAGVLIPGHMQGQAFLGASEAPARTHIFAARDRMDERYDIIRATRDDHYKYIRNYEPYRPYDQYLTYPENFPVMQDLRRAHAAGELKGPELQFFRQRKPLEELFDIQADPHEIRNLAGEAEFAPVLDRMRGVMDDWLRDIRDLGLVPEIELDAWRGVDTATLPKSDTTYAPLGVAGVAVFGRDLDTWIAGLNADDPLERLRAAAAIALAGPVATPVLIQMLNDANPCVAYWGANGLGHMEAGDDAVKEALSSALERPNITVQLAAAEALLRLFGPNEELDDRLIAASTHENPRVRLRAVQILEEFPKTASVRAALEKATEDKDGYVPRVAEHALTLE